MRKPLAYLFIFLVMAFLAWYAFESFKLEDNTGITGQIAANGTNLVAKSPPDDEFNTDKLHWNHMPVSFSFSNENSSDQVKCQDFQKGRARQAFNLIQNSTNNLVSFAEVEGQADIVVRCYGAKAESPMYMLAGEGGYSSYGNIIENGTLNFYTHLNCGTWPDLEMHEILHVFGFQHKDDESSIMNPVAKKCDLGKIDDDILNSLRETYS